MVSYPAIGGKSDLSISYTSLVWLDIKNGPKNIKKNWWSCHQKWWFFLLPLPLLWCIHHNKGFFRTVALAMFFWRGFINMKHTWVLFGVLSFFVLFFFSYSYCPQLFHPVKYLCLLHQSLRKKWHFSMWRHLLTHCWQCWSTILLMGCVEIFV